MKLKIERNLNYLDPVTVEFFQNNGTSNISLILLTNGWTEGRKDRQTNGREFNISLAEVIRVARCHLGQFVNIAVKPLLGKFGY